jgi:hypothetical protein
MVAGVIHGATNVFNYPTIDALGNREVLAL